MDFHISYIDTNEALGDLVESLSKKKQIYIDLEFDKNHFRYGFNLCLMQIFDGEYCFLIDPVSHLDIDLLFPVLENKYIELVCFAFNEDMRLLHYLGAKPNNIVDLGVAMRVLNYETLSLNNSLNEILGEESPVIDKKSQQKSNWFQRPLTEQQHLYAAEDVLYLPELYKQLSEQLSSMNRREWFAQEMEAFENYDWSGGEKVAYLTKKDQKQLTLREWIRFEKMMHYREQLGASLKRPTYKVWDKNIVLAIAARPGKVADWKTLKGVHPKLRVDKVQNKIKSLLDEAEREIKENKITENQSSIPPLSNDQRTKINNNRRRVQNLKENFFAPLKEEIKNEYGENYSNYFLSNRKMVEYVNKEQVLLPYQKEMILDTAKKLNLELPEFVVE